MPSKEYYKRLEKLKNPEPPKPIVKKKAKRVRAADTVNYQKMKSTVSDTRTVMEKWYDDRIAIHNAIRSENSIVPVFAAFRTIDQKLIEDRGLRLEDITVLLKIQSLDFFKGGQYDSRSVTRLLKSKLVGVTRVKYSNNYFITYEGKAFLIDLKKYVIKSFISVVKLFK